MALLLNCPAMKSSARLLQVKAKGDELTDWHWQEGQQEEQQLSQKAFTSEANILKYPGNMLCSHSVL